MTLPKNLKRILISGTPLYIIVVILLALAFLLPKAHDTKIKDGIKFAENMVKQITTTYDGNLDELKPSFYYQDQRILQHKQLEQCIVTQKMTGSHCDKLGDMTYDAGIGCGFKVQKFNSMTITSSKEDKNYIILSADIKIDYVHFCHASDRPSEPSMGKYTKTIKDVFIVLKEIENDNTKKVPQLEDRYQLVNLNDFRKSLSQYSVIWDRQQFIDN